MVILRKQHGFDLSHNVMCISSIDVQGCNSLWQALIAVHSACTNCTGLHRCPSTLLTAYSFLQLSVISFYLIFHFAAEPGSPTKVVHKNHTSACTVYYIYWMAWNVANNSVPMAKYRRLSPKKCLNHFRKKYVGTFASFHRIRDILWKWGIVPFNAGQLTYTCILCITYNYILLCAANWQTFQDIKVCSEPNNCIAVNLNVNEWQWSRL